MPKASNNKPSPAERYLDYLERLIKEEPVIYQDESLTKGLPGVTTFVYENVPEPGNITAFTYGLSLVDHPEWKLGRAELCICVESNDHSWGLAIGWIANNLRGQCPFSYGESIDFGDQISDDSEMDSFLIFAPNFLEKEYFLNIDIGADYKINLACLYPVYSDELKVYDKIGFEAFWKHPDFDPYKVTRKQIKL
jgi:hypothetical protein